MRRTSPAFVIGASLLIAACSTGDRPATPTGPSEQPSGPDLAVSSTDPVCSVYPAKQATAIQQILTELGYVYPRFSPPLVALQLISNLLGTALARAQQISAQQFAVQIINRLQSDLKAGKLQSPPTSNIGKPPFVTAADVVNDLVKRLQCLTALPVTGNSPDAGVGIVTPNAAATITTGSQTSGVFFPPNTVNSTSVITVQRLPDGPVLLTSLNQFPEFFEISSSNPNAQITQQNSVIVGICNVVDNNGLPNLLIAHNVGTNFGDVEVLPPVPATFLNCAQTSSSAAAPPRNFAAASWRAVSAKVGSVARTLFLPPELHASMLLAGGPGGYTGKFSPFGTVNIASNPATLMITDASGNPTSGVVTTAGNVYVKAISSGLTYHLPNPIPNVPVNFGGTIKNTGPDGIASFNWTGGGTAGATLTATVPNDPVNCPTAPTTPVTTAYRPLVCFTPSSVTFTNATVIDYSTAGYGSLAVGPNFGNQSPPTLSFPTDTQNVVGEGVTSWSSPNFTQTGHWASAPTPFGQLVSPACSIYGTNPVGVSSLWPAATGGSPSPSTGSGLLLRRTFTAPSGFAGHIVIKVAIDNDIQVFIDGHDVTDGSVYSGVTFLGVATNDVVNGSWSGYAAPFQTHGGCAARDSGIFTVPASALSGGASHTLAVYAHDYGGDSYVDVQVTLAP